MELKPCPFCGSEAEAHLAAGWAPMINCSNENCNVALMDMDGVFLDDVVKQWNTRAHEKQGAQNG